MEDYSKAILDLSKHCSTEYVTVSRKVTHRPCYVFKVIVSPTTTGTATRCYLRNGETSNAPILLNLGGQYAHPTHDGELPIYFNKGLYVELGQNEDGATVQYFVWPEV
jgi:hypothetical protein